MDSLPQDVDGIESVEVLCRFRREVYTCLDARADALFGLADAVLCAAGPVRSLPELSRSRSIVADTAVCMTG